MTRSASTVHCPVCDEQSEQVYRCSVCGADLVNRRSTEEGER
ncbi:transposase [Natrarchaeobaculum sulfurireducens]|nr:transposase [Natrarchaeobaculum sulfurireducens]